jgi:hypothetical protein
LPARTARGSVGSVNTPLTPQQRRWAHFVGWLLIPAAMWCFYGIFYLIDTYLFRLTPLWD